MGFCLHLPVCPGCTKGKGGGDNDCVCVSALVRVCGCECNGVRGCCIYVHPRVRPIRAWDTEQGGNNPRAIYICTPAPTPRTRAGATGATQGAARTQQASAPRPQDCARPCSCIAVPKHRSAPTGTPLQNAQSRAGTIPGPYTSAHQRQRHAHEQVQPGHLREQPGPSGLLRPDHRTARGPCSCIAVPKHRSALTGTPLRNAQSRAVGSQTHVGAHTVGHSGLPRPFRSAGFPHPGLAATGPPQASGSAHGVPGL